jgi:hypothetical protein
METAAGAASGPHTPRITVQLDAIGAAPRTGADSSLGAGDDAEFDPGATVASAVVPSPTPGSTPSSIPNSIPGVGPRPRKNTLANAIRPRNSDEHRAIPAYHPDSDELSGDFAADSGPWARLSREPMGAYVEDEIPDETDGADDWSVVDQPTVQLVHQMLAASLPAAHGGVGPGAAQGVDPASVQPSVQPSVQRGQVTNERASWPSLAAADAAAQQTPSSQQPKTTQSIHPDLLGGPRYAAPDGKLMQMTPPTGVPPVAANVRRERFQELRESRKAHEQGGRAPHDTPHVSEVVRTWWRDLLPGVQGGLRAQHEARASGTYAAPEYLATAVSWLGDVFGKVAVSTRELANRAQQNTAPTLKRWHQWAEQYAQGLIERLEGSPIQQQAPFLAPGRIAVLFRSGVSMAQAQRLLMNAQARPMRAIPNKHGFLALVRPGREADVAERLKLHPYVRDVIYMQYSPNDDPSRSLSVEVPALAAMRG